jgi:ArsR family transcriptional regulator, arsenate/arsenite/antimonite-responsive transcriptional repressor
MKQFVGLEATAMKPIEEVDAVQIARVLGDPVRFSIYRHIIELNEMRCGDICLESPVHPSTVSHHLKVLSHAGLVESRRDRQVVYYRLVPEMLEAYLQYLGALLHVGHLPPRFDPKPRNVRT